jgi:uncharacterized protein YceH (UPF0502 family)
MSLRPLSLLETRVLGVLVEKQHTVPDSYPLAQRADAGCNQKTARDPVLDATEAEVQDAVDELRVLSLVVEAAARAWRVTSTTPAACSRCPRNRWRCCSRC